MIGSHVQCCTACTSSERRWLLCTSQHSTKTLCHDLRLMQPRTGNLAIPAAHLLHPLREAAAEVVLPQVTVLQSPPYLASLRPSKPLFRTGLFAVVL